MAKTRELWPTKESSGVGENQKLEHCLSVHVSAQAFSRAMRIFDALIKKWEELGGSVRVDPTRFVFNEDSVGVSLSEEMDRVEKNRDENRYWKDWEYKHTGRLVLEISGRWERNFRKHWADGKKQQLENILGSFIEGLRKWIANERVHRLDDEIRERQRSKALEVHTRREELAKKFAQQAKHLEQCAANFAQSEEIRKYLETFENKIDQGLIRPTNPETFPGWLEWAKWYADYLDPLTPTPMRENYSVLPKNMPVTDLEWTGRTQLIVETLGVTDTDELYRVDRQTVINIGNMYNSSEWSEIGLVLEGLGYDVSDNRYKY